MDETRAYWNGREACHRRTMIKAAGYNDKDIRTKPHIGIANSFMEGSPGTAHLRQLAEYVKQGIWAAGGVPFEFGIPGTCGVVADGAEEIKFDQIGRDIVAASVELVTRVHRFDGLVTIASCDNIIAGCYLAQARMDIPTLCVTGGCMDHGMYKGKKIVEAELDVAVYSGETEETVLDMEDHVCPSFGACPSMGTANTMQMTGEIMNLVLPGTGTIPASGNEKLRKCRDAGRMIVEMTKADRKPSDLITRDTMLNACKFSMAVAGSTNVVLHIMAIARELGIEITMDDFAECAARIPCISGVIPSGPYTVVDFHYAGGALQVMKNLGSEINTDVPSMDGRTWKELLAPYKAEENEVIKTLEHPLFTKPGLKVLYGNLTPRGAIVRPTAVPREMEKFSGRARIFHNDFDSIRAIEEGDIKPGDVIVVRYEGCKGAPGMKELMLTADALIGYGLHTSVGLVTDARFSGFNYGAIIGHITPEAAEGGPIALVREGDVISIDVNEGIVTLEVSDEELEERRKDWTPPETKAAAGFANLYQRLCRPADQGGAMQPWGLKDRYQSAKPPKIK